MKKCETAELGLMLESNLEDREFYEPAEKLRQHHSVRYELYEYNKDIFIKELKQYSNATQAPKQE